MTLYLDNYLRSEKRRLLLAVESLCAELKRPVCSSDVRAYLERNPAHRPNLIQCLGQTLIKAARTPKYGVPALCRVGLWGNQAYYAPDANASWLRSFEEFKRKERIGRLLREHYPDRIMSLLDGPYDRAARNALAGWIAEVRELAGDAPHAGYEADLIAEAGQIQALAAPRFIPARDLDFVPRSEARRMLQSEIEQRCPEKHGLQINYERYLAELRWPHSILYPRPPSPRFLRPMIQTFVTAKWPLTEEDQDLALSLYALLKYP